MVFGKKKKQEIPKEQSKPDVQRIIQAEEPKECDMIEQLKLLESRIKELEESMEKAAETFKSLAEKFQQIDTRFKEMGRAISRKEDKKQ